MNKVISFLSILIGSVFFLSGFIKLMGGLQTTVITFAGVSFWYTNYTNPIFIIIFNFILGGGFTYYSISTFKFHSKKRLATNTDQIDINQNIKVLPLKTLSTFQKVTGALSIMLGLYFVYRGIGLTAVMGSSDLTVHWLPFIFACLFLWTKALVPIILFGKNTMLNSMIIAKAERKKKAEKRARIQKIKMQSQTV